MFEIAGKLENPASGAGQIQGLRGLEMTRAVRKGQPKNFSLGGDAGARQLTLPGPHLGMEVLESPHLQVSFF